MQRSKNECKYLFIIINHDPIFQNVHLDEKMIVKRKS